MGYLKMSENVQNKVNEFPEDCRIDSLHCCDGSGYTQICLSKHYCKYQKSIPTVDKEPVNLCMR